MPTWINLLLTFPHCITSNIHWTFYVLSCSRLPLLVLWCPWPNWNIFISGFCSQTLISWKNISLTQTKLRVAEAFLVRSPHVRSVASSKRKHAGGNSLHPWLFRRSCRVWPISGGTHYSPRSKMEGRTLVKMDSIIHVIPSRFLLLLPSLSTAIRTPERSKKSRSVARKWRCSGWDVLCSASKPWCPFSNFGSAAHGIPCLVSQLFHNSTLQLLWFLADVGKSFMCISRLVD